jgi:hypothetical protein
LRFRGHDNFSRDICDNNTELFGERNTKLRKACQDKRRHFIEIYRRNPTKFLQLCSEFDTLAQHIKSNKQGEEQQFLEATRSFAHRLSNIDSSDDSFVSDTASTASDQEQESTAGTSSEAEKNATKKKPAQKSTPLRFDAATLTASTLLKLRPAVMPTHTMSHRNSSKSRNGK